MNYLSVCAGIEAATVAWHDLGWKATAYSEIEPFPSAVLAHHYPHTPNLGDMTRYRDWSIDEPVNLLVGGTPCQSFSVAGLRKGLDDPRGNLALVYLGIADHLRPKWIVWENVPGVLSSNRGRDFGAFLGALGQLGYGWAYRVLDAQFFGVAQRRRRVFVVGCLGDWASAAAVLFERESLRRDTAPSREARKDITECAGTLTANGGGLNRPAGNANELDFCVTVELPKTKTFTPASHGAYREGVGTLRAHGGDLGGGSESLIAQPVSNVAHCLETTCHDYSRADGFNMVMQPAYGIPGNWIGRKPENGGNAVEPMHNLSPCLTSTDKHGVAQPIPLDLRNAGRDPEKQDAMNRQGLGVGAVGDPAHTVTTACVHGVAQPIAFGWQNSASQGLSDSEKVTPTLDKSKTPAVAQPVPEYYSHDYCQDRVYSTTGLSPALNCSQLHSFRTDMAVRRLTPVECERLQGFPDNYTRIAWRKKQPEDCPDGPRYKALGNSMAVPVMRWIGERIAAVEALT